MKWLCGIVVSVMGIVIVSGFLLVLTGYRLYENTGRSLPAHWYLCRPLIPGEQVQPGALVHLEPPPYARRVVQRFVPEEDPARLWIKHAIGQAGDTLCLTGDSVILEGAVIAQRPLLQRYPLVAVDGCWQLRSEDIFVMGTHPHSYDARYTGPWTRGTIRGRCQALRWPWEHTP